MSDLDDMRESVLQAVKDVFDQFNALRQEVTEYRRTVNNAIGLLSKEILDFTTHDIAERKKRQKRQDYKDLALGCFLLLTILSACSIIAALGYVVWSSYVR